MAKIDLGNFGVSTIQVAPQARTEVIGEAVQQIGSQIGQIAQKKIEERFQQQAALASNNLLDHQLNNQKIVLDIQDKLASGDLTPEDAANEYKNQSASNVLPKVDHLTPEAAAMYTRGSQRVQAEGTFKIDALAEVARKHRFQDQFEQGLDKLGKLAGSPGTTPDQTQAIIEQAKTYSPVGRHAGIPAVQVDKAIQDFTDQTWLNQAVQRSIENHDNMAGLRQLQKDLSEKDGFYDGKLDTNKRNAIMAQVGNRIDTIQAHLEHVAATRDTDAARAVNEMARQDATGVKAPPEQWANWAQRTKGTSYAPDFADAVVQEQQTQELLKLPVNEQISAMKAEEKRINTEGATVRDQINFARKYNAVQKNAALMQQAPLMWGQDRLGLSVPPLDLSTLLTPAGSTALQAQISQRALQIQTMQAQQGPGIQMRPLLPQEATMLGQIVAATTPKNAAATFASLQHIAGEPSVYMGMMAQIAPDHPVLAFAGRRAAQDPKVAINIVAGEAVLNPTKDAKLADGKPNSALFVPTDKSLQSAFTTYTGTAYRDHKDVAEVSFQAFKAAYVGKAIHDGAQLEDSNVPDSKLVQDTLKDVVGTVVNYNNKGDVIAPWGMDKGTFNKRVDAAWAVLAKKYPEIAAMSGAQLAQVGLVNGPREGQYLIPSGGQYLAVHPGPGKPLQTVIIDLTSPAVIGYVSPDRVFTDPRSGMKASTGQ